MIMTTLNPEEGKTEPQIRLRSSFTDSDSHTHAQTPSTATYMVVTSYIKSPLTSSSPCNRLRSMSYIKQHTESLSQGQQ
jgi:hypothetical protein